MTRRGRDTELDRLLREVATSVVDEGLDLEKAVARAARHGGVNLQHRRPSREALHAAVDEYRGLFRPQQAEMLRRMRETALHAMRTLQDFQPRLTGPLVHGDGPLDRIRLLLVAETPEQVILHLHDRHIPWRDAEVALHYSNGRREMQPALRFVAGDASIELIVLDRRGLSNLPRNPITGGPIDTLNTAQVEDLVGAGAG